MNPNFLFDTNLSLGELDRDPDLWKVDGGIEKEKKGRLDGRGFWREINRWNKERQGFE